MGTPESLADLGVGKGSSAESRPVIRIHRIRAARAMPSGSYRTTKEGPGGYQVPLGVIDRPPTGALINGDVHEIVVLLLLLENHFFIVLPDQGRLPGCLPSHQLFIASGLRLISFLPHSGHILRIQTE